MASSIVSPWLKQPGKDGTSNEYPPSSALCTITVYCIRRSFSQQIQKLFLGASGFPDSRFQQTDLQLSMKR
jgi:hypothetical protein